jgi:hypothetical protein
LDHHFVGKSPLVRHIFDQFLAMVESFGPVEVLPEKSRIAFHVRMSFARLAVQRHWVVGHLVLARAVHGSLLFTRVESLSPRNHVHHFRIDQPGRVQAFRELAREAYAVGRQEHLGSAGEAKSR